MTSDFDPATRDWTALRGVDWANEAKLVLRAEMKRRGLSYSDLSARLAAMGLQESEANLRNKVSRGTFTASFLLQCFAAIGTPEIALGDSYRFHRRRD